MAPESLKDQKYSTKSDSWMFGCLLYEIVTRQVPYKLLPLHEIAIKVCSGQLRLQMPSDAPPLLAQIAMMCTQIDPDKRPDFAAITSMLTKEVCSSHLQARCSPYPPDRAEILSRFCWWRYSAQQQTERRRSNRTRRSGKQLR
jgi:hypothetical protein